MTCEQTNTYIFFLTLQFSLSQFLSVSLQREFCLVFLHQNPLILSVLLVQPNMSHALLRPAQIMPVNSYVPKTSTPKLASFRRRRIFLVRSSSAAADVDSDSALGNNSSSSSFLEKCFAAPPAPVAASVAPLMKGKYGALGAVTLEKSKLDMSQKQTKSSPEVSALPSSLSLFSFTKLGFSSMFIVQLAE